MAQNEPTRGSRLSIPLTDNGLIDFDHMRPSSAQKLVDLIKTDPTIRDTYKEVNEPGGGEPALFDGLTTENVAGFLDLVANANGLLLRVMAARFVKHPLLRDATTGKHLPLFIDQDVIASMGFTAKQHAELDPRATRLAQKYSSKMPAWLKENLDLYMFGSMFLAYTAQNAKAALETQIKRDVMRVQGAFASAKAAEAKRQPQPDTDVRTNSDVQPQNGKPWADRAEEFGRSVGYAAGAAAAKEENRKNEPPPDTGRPLV